MLQTIIIEFTRVTVDKQVRRRVKNKLRKQNKSAEQRSSMANDFVEHEVKIAISSIIDTTGKVGKASMMFIQEFIEHWS